MAYATAAQATTFFGANRSEPTGWAALTDAQKLATLELVSTRFDALPWTDEGTTPRYNGNTLAAAPLVQAAFYATVAQVVENGGTFDRQPVQNSSIGGGYKTPIFLHSRVSDLPFYAQTILVPMLTLPTESDAAGNAPEDVIRRRIGGRIYERPSAGGAWTLVADDTKADARMAAPMEFGQAAVSPDGVEYLTRQEAEQLFPTKDAIAGFRDLPAALAAGAGKVVGVAENGGYILIPPSGLTPQQAADLAANTAARQAGGGGITPEQVAAIVANTAGRQANAAAILALQQHGGVTPSLTQAQVDFLAALREPHVAGAVVFIAPYDGIFKVKSGQGTADAIKAGTMEAGTAAQGAQTGTPNVLITTPLNAVQKVLVLENLTGNDSTLISLEVPNLNGVGFSRIPYLFRAADTDGKTRYFFRNIDGAQANANTATGIEAKNGDSLAISETAASGDPTAESFVISIRRAGANEVHAQNTITAPAGTLARARFNRVLVPASAGGAFRSWSAVAIIHHAGAYASHSTVGLIDLVHAGDYYGIAAQGPGSDKLQFTRALDFTVAPTLNGQPFGGGATPSQNDPEHIRAAWFGGGDPREGAPYSTPAATLWTLTNNGSNAFPANGFTKLAADSAFPAGISINGDGQLELSAVAGGRNASVRAVWTNAEIDFTAIAATFELNVGGNHNNVAFYFGANTDSEFPTTNNGKGTLTKGISIGYVSGTRALYVYRGDGANAHLQADGTWGNAAHNHAAPDTIPTTGDLRMRVIWLKGRLIVRINGIDALDIFTDGDDLPDLTGGSFGAVLEAYGGFSGTTHILRMDGIAVEDVTSDDIDPHAHAASGGGAATPEVVLTAYTGGLNRENGFAILDNAIDLTQQWDEMNITANDNAADASSSVLLPSVSMSAVKREYKAVSGLSDSRTHQIDISAIAAEPGGQEPGGQLSYGIVGAIRLEGTANSITHISWASGANENLRTVKVVRWAQSGVKGDKGDKGDAAKAPSDATISGTTAVFTQAQLDDHPNGMLLFKSTGGGAGAGDISHSVPVSKLGANISTFRMWGQGKASWTASTRTLTMTGGGGSFAYATLVG